MWRIINRPEMQEFLINLDSELLMIMAKQPLPLTLIGAMFDLYSTGHSEQALVVADIIEQVHQRDQMFAWLAMMGGVLRLQYDVSWEEVQQFFEFCYGAFGFIAIDLYSESFEYARQMREAGDMN